MSRRPDAYATLRAANVDMAFATAFITLMTGPFLVGFVQSLGGGDRAIGLLAGLPALAGLLQIPGAILARRVASYKRFVTWFGTGWRVLQIPIMVLPILALPESFRLAALLVFVTLASVVVSFSNPVYNEWLSVLVPQNSRGWFFARRNALAAMVGATVGIAGAAILDATRDAKGEPSPLGFSVVFGLGILCAAISLTFFLKMDDARREKVERVSLRDGLKSVTKPFADPVYRRTLIFIVVSVFGQTFAGNLYAAYGREVLNLNFRYLQGQAVAMAVGNLLAARAWGFLSDRYGNKPTMGLAMVLLATNPIPWLISRPGAQHETYNGIMLLVTHVLMGAAWAGVNLTQFNLMLATSKPERRADDIAAGLAIVALVSGIAPNLASEIMVVGRQWMSSEHAYKTVFFAVLVLRLVSVGVLSIVREEGSRGFRRTLRDLTAMRPSTLGAVRVLNRPTDPEARREALHLASEQDMEIAAESILQALQDPLPRVRREAAAAIGALRDERAVQSLLTFLDEHPDLVEEPLLEALGRLGDPRAIPALVASLNSPRPLLRRAAARALGRMGDALEPDGADALIAAASEARDPDLRRASLQALRNAEIVRGADAIASALRDTHPSVRIAAAEAVSEMELKGAAPALRAALELPFSEAHAELAYALGVCGEASDLPLILRQAQAAGSSVSRRRALLGAARLFGVERETYRLMLTEGMARDAALVAMTPRRHPNARAVARLAAAGDEVSALKLLAKRDPRFEEFVTTPVEEGILVALPAAVSISETEN